MKTNGRSKIESDDRAVAIYHLVYAHEGFEESAQILFKLVQKAQRMKPGRKRKLFLDIEGHRNSEGSFDADMSELQTEFLMGFLSRFLLEIQAPLLSTANQYVQENDTPLKLIIQNELEDETQKTT